MVKVLFNLEMEYHYNSLFPLLLELKKDPTYEIKLRTGKDPGKFLGIFYLSQRKKMIEKYHRSGYQLTDETAGFDLVIAGDALSDPDKYQGACFFNLDHGVGIKTSRIRNIVKQINYRYHVILEGDFWYDYIRSLNWADKANFHLTGMPKLDPLFWNDHYDLNKIRAAMKLDLSRKTILFAPSYKPSCIEFLQDKILNLVPDYNLIIKLHPYSWKGRYAPHSHHRFYEKITRKFPGVYLISQEIFDIYPFLLISDTLISDTSSVINEYLALGKFGIIYELPHYKKKHSDGMDILAIDPKQWFINAFPHISDPAELKDAVEAALNPSATMLEKHHQYRKYFFTGLDGKASQRVKKIIDSIFKD